MADRITVIATEHPVPLPNGRSVQPASIDPEGTEVDRDLFIERRLAAGELMVKPVAAPPSPVKPAAKDR